MCGYIYVYISVIIVSLSDSLIWRYRHHQKFPRNGLSFSSLVFLVLAFYFQFCCGGVHNYKICLTIDVAICVPHHYSSQFGKLD
jgi:hypothetical protein